MRGPRRLAASLALAALAMTGCASSDDVTVGSGSAATTSASPSPTADATVREPSQQPQEQTIRVTISGGKVDPPPGRVQVDKGRTVRLVISSDQADKVHVHGYDLEAPVGPGVPATITFTAGQTGLFEVETHESEQVLLQLQVK